MLKHNATQNSVVEAMTCDLPFQRLDIYHSFKFLPEQLEEGVEVKDVVKASPLNGRRFDTIAIVITDDAAEGVSLTNMRIGRVKVIFRLLATLQIIGSYKSSTPAAWPQTPLAYIEWYTSPTLSQSSSVTHFFLLLRLHFCAIDLAN
ncbi:hypothetical protein BDP27DRAFT_1431347 [Rhodocollybia butyracea]|uniref:Uncharacterized protein n=1 Tax=Rhodocollybia butyracea TaxID=206335 RepID=A0A9P5P723_9AGAR|nr:hypothetical protein BDP27DRAFT_1431347 [Rhodocollybia butyracea]